jgi:hypothetical protein
MDSKLPLERKFIYIENFDTENINQLGFSDAEQETTNTPSWCLGIILLTKKIYIVL